MTEDMKQLISITKLPTVVDAPVQPCLTLDQNRIWRILDSAECRGQRPTEQQVASDRYNGAVPVSRWRSQQS